MPNLVKVNEALVKAEAALAELRSALNEQETIVVPQTPMPEETFETLKAVLDSDRWPVCANKNLICDPNDDAAKVQRGRGVVELMVEGELAGKHFLDIGCGEGHAAAYAATKGTALSVGYDVLAKNWENKVANNLKLTTQWEEVVNLGPYNSILIFDVIDHLVNETAVEVLQKAASVLATDGRIYIRTHPFTSRHATHNYHDLNKGWIHLVFNDEELSKLIPDPKHLEPNTGGVKFPFATYKNYFDQAGLEIVNNRPVKDNVEPFFQAPAIANRIIKNLGMKEFPDFQLSMQFIDYNLRKF